MIDISIGGAAHEAYQGLLDVLVSLVRANRYPAGRLPVAEITRQFLVYMRQAEEADIELGGEFVYAAAWLTLLKSRALLPVQAGEELPEAELERALLDHEALRATAQLLAEHLAEGGLTAGSLARPLPGIEVEEPLVQGPLTIADVLAAARRSLAIEEARTAGAASVPPPDLYTVESAIVEIEQRTAALPPCRGISTETWFIEAPGPEAEAALLLGLLELAKLNRVLLHQPVPCGPILLQRTA